MSDYSRRDILENVSLGDVEPFTGKLEDLPQKVKECEKSIREDKPDMDKSKAIAICRDQLDMADSDCPEGEVMVNGRCISKEEVDDVPPGALQNSAIYQLADLESEPIEREELGEDKVAYRNVKILQSGTWTDSASRETVWYSPRGLDNMELTEDNAVNIMHDDDNEVSESGHLDNLRADDGSLYADIIIDKSNSAGMYADENLQQTLKTQGANGFGGPSVEIPPDGQKMEYNEEKGMRELVKGKIDGLGLVRNPASKPTSFARQSSTRAVALSDSQSVMQLKGEGVDMPDIDALRSELENAGFDLSDKGDETIMSLAEGIGLADEEDEEGDEEEEEEEDVENEEDEEPPEEEEEAPEEEEEPEEEMDMETKVESLEERLTNLEDMMEQAMAAEDVQEELEEFEQDLADAETVQELSEAKEDLEKRLSELEDRPQSPRSLSDGADTEGKEDTDGDVNYSPIETGGRR